MMQQEIMHSRPTVPLTKRSSLFS